MTRVIKHASFQILIALAVVSASPFRSGTTPDLARSPVPAARSAIASELALLLQSHELAQNWNFHAAFERFVHSAANFPGLAFGMSLEGSWSITAFFCIAFRFPKARISVSIIATILLSLNATGSPDASGAREVSCAGDVKFAAALDIINLMLGRVVFTDFQSTPPLVPKAGILVLVCCTFLFQQDA